MCTRTENVEIGFASLESIKKDSQQGRLKCIDRAQGILLVLIGIGLGTNKAKYSGF